MRNSGTLVVMMVGFSLAGGVDKAWAAPDTPAPPPSVTSVAPAPSIRASIEAGRHTLVPLTKSSSAKHGATDAQPGQRRMSGALRAVIWAAAITVTSTWAYKTFSETRGTD